MGRDMAIVITIVLFLLIASGCLNPGTAKDGNDTKRCSDY